MPQIENMKLYIIAGEASGDLHASNLIKSLKKENQEIEFRCWGGDKMKDEGVFIVKHIKELAFMGFIEVISNIRTILKNIRFCKEDIEEFKPDALILVDYPGFNLRIAEWAKNKGIKVIYYISPQVWAWKQSRVHKIKRFVDKMFVILPFEKEFYERFDFQVEYVGHPLLDAIELYQQSARSSDEFRQMNSLDSLPIIAVLPGSRKQEVSVKLPIMLKALADFPAYQFIIAGAPSLDATFYMEIIGNIEANQNVRILYNQTYDLLSASEAAIVTSGTATLETALLEIPEVVCYKGSAISYHIAKRLIKIDYISLVNLIMGKEVVKELIQQDCKPEAIRKELQQIIIGGKKRASILENYKELKKIVGGGGASEKVAQSLLKTIRS
jgi:lipid-A-disaccharide synthase